MKQKLKKRVDFRSKHRHILKECCYGEEYFCDGKVNKSVGGWESRVPKRPCQEKACQFKKTTVLK